MSDLVTAAGNGELARVRELLEGERASLNAALGAAVRSGRLDVARFLLEQGADPKSHHDSLWGPLSYAARSGLEMLELVLKFGADVQVRDREGRDTLDIYLLMNGSTRGEVKADLAVVKYLLEAGLPVRTGSHLLAACRSESVPIVELLLERGADPNQQGILSVTALRTHGGPMLAALVKAGIAPNTHEVDQFRDTTILTEVCAHGDLQSATLLLDRGADVNARGTSSPLARAIESGNQVLVDLLLERGARPLVEPLARELTHALDLAERRARASPEDASARLEWAKTLHASGFRAAAACEAEALRRRGVEVPPELSSFEAHGAKWTFVELPQREGPAPRTIDERFPGAKVNDGARTVPLLLTMSTPCTTCDEKGEEVCSDCNGTSSHLDSDGFGGYREEWCPPRQHCSACFGLKFKSIARRFSKGACSHPQLDDELKMGSFVFRRCRACGLASIYGETHWRYRNDDYFACAACSRFSCTCVTRA